MLLLGFPHRDESAQFNFFNDMEIWKLDMLTEKSKMLDIVFNSLDENLCRRSLFELIHPVPACPRCGAKLSIERHDRFYKNRVNSCSSCKKKYFASTGTFLNSAKMTFKEILIILLLIDFGFRYSEILRFIPQCKGTLNLWLKKHQVFKKLI